MCLTRVCISASPCTCISPRISTSSDLARRYYPLFGLGANVALIFSGLYVRYVSGLRRTWAGASAVAGAAAGAIDPWGKSLRYLMGAVTVSGGLILAIFRYSLRHVAPFERAALSLPPRSLHGRHSNDREQSSGTSKRE